MQVLAHGSSVVRGLTTADEDGLKFIHGNMFRICKVQMSYHAREVFGIGLLWQVQPGQKVD